MHVRMARHKLCYAIGSSILISMLIILSGNVHPNPGPEQYHDLSICHSNIRSLKALDRMTHVKCHLTPVHDIITISETWLSHSDKDELYLLNGYQTPFRRDRLHGAEGYGGVLAWISNSIACKRRIDFESPEIDSMWLEIRSNNNKFFLCVIYRSESNTDDSFWEILQDQIDLAKQEHKPKIIITGDFNADPQTRQGNLLKNIAYINDMTLLVEEPTRVTPNSATILDQFVTNIPHCTKAIKVLPPVSGNDHCTIVMEFLFRVSKGEVYKRLMWNYKESDFELYRNTLAQTNFDECFTYDSIDEICESCTKLVLEVAKETLKHKIVTVRPKDKPW